MKNKKRTSGLLDYPGPYLGVRPVYEIIFLSRDPSVKEKNVVLNLKDVWSVPVVIVITFPPVPSFIYKT